MSNNTDSLFLATMQDIKELQEFFSAALSRLQEGEMTSMNGIDRRIAAICQSAQNSPPEQQRAFLPELTVLIKLLNEYEGELRKIQSSLAIETAKGEENGGSG